MELLASSLAKSRSRQSRRVRSLDLPTVRQEFKKKKNGERVEIWVVDGRDHEGNRYRLTCHSKPIAEAKAREQHELFKQQFRLGVALPIAVQVEALEAHQKGISIREAVAFFEKNRPKTEPVLVRVATEAYVYDREIIQKCGSGVSQMKHMFKRLNAWFGDRFLHELQIKELEKWLLLQQNEKNLKVFAPIGDERRNTLLKLIRALFTFSSGKARGWVPPDHNSAKEIPFIKIDRPDPCTLSPEETARFLKLVLTFPKDVRAYAVLRIFAPIRRCEFGGLDWSKLKDRNLRVLGTQRPNSLREMGTICRKAFSFTSGSCSFIEPVSQRNSIFWLAERFFPKNLRSGVSGLEICPLGTPGIYAQIPRLRQRVRTEAGLNPAICRLRYPSRNLKTLVRVPNSFHNRTRSRISTSK
jgi:hypothetical protein